MPSLKTGIFFLKKKKSTVRFEIDLQEETQLSLRKVNLRNALHTEFSNQHEPVRVG